MHVRASTVWHDTCTRRLTHGFCVVSVWGLYACRLLLGYAHAWCTCHRLMGCLVAYMHGTTCSRAHMPCCARAVQKAEVLFDAIDANQDGVISKFEMNDFCSKQVAHVAALLHQLAVCAVRMMHVVWWLDWCMSKGGCTISAWAACMHVCRHGLTVQWRRLRRAHSTRPSYDLALLSCSPPCLLMPRATLCRSASEATLYPGHACDDSMVCFNYATPTAAWCLGDTSRCMLALPTVRVRLHVGIRSSITNALLRFTTRFRGYNLQPSCGARVVLRYSLAMPGWPKLSSCSIFPFSADRAPFCCSMQPPHPP